jgi:hypothetical protein
MRREVARRGAFASHIRTFGGVHDDALLVPVFPELLYLPPMGEG